MRDCVGGLDHASAGKCSVEDPDSEAAEALLKSDPSLVTGRHTVVEVRHNLARVLDPRDATAAKAAFIEDVPTLCISRPRSAWAARPSHSSPST